MPHKRREKITYHLSVPIVIIMKHLLKQLKFAQKSLLRAAHVCILTESVSPLGGTLVACEVIQRLHWHISNLSILNVLGPFRNTLNTLWVAIITKYFTYNTQNNRLCVCVWGGDRQHVYFHLPIHTLPLSVVYILAFTWLCNVQDSVAHISVYSV